MTTGAPYQRSPYQYSSAALKFEPGVELPTVRVPARSDQAPHAISLAQPTVEQVYLRRRLAAVVVISIFLYGLYALLAGAAGLADAAASSAAPLDPTTATFAQASNGDVIALSGRALPTHVVMPGDTLWSIAATLDSGGDLRPIVDQLVSLNDGVTVLQPGQRLLLPDYSR